MKEVEKVDSQWPTLDSLTLISWQADLHFDGQLRRRLDVASDLIEPEKEEDSFQFRAKLSFFDQTQLQQQHKVLHISDCCLLLGGRLFLLEYRGAVAQSVEHPSKVPGHGATQLMRRGFDSRQRRGIRW